MLLRERDRDKERQRETDRQTDRQTNRQTNRETERYRERDRNTQREREMARDRERLRERDRQTELFFFNCPAFMCVSLSVCVLISLHHGAMGWFVCDLLLCHCLNVCLQNCESEYMGRSRKFRQGNGGPDNVFFYLVIPTQS